MRDKTTKHYRPPSIAEKGLRQHITDLGFDYDLYDERMREQQKPAAIALALETKSGKRLQARTVKGWAAYWTANNKASA